MTSFSARLQPVGFCLAIAALLFVSTVDAVLYVSSSAGYCANTNPYRGFTRGFVASGTATTTTVQAAIDGFTAFNSRTSPFSPGAFPGAAHSYRGLAFGGNLNDALELRFAAADAAAPRCVDLFGPACGADSYGIVGLKFEAALPLTWQASSIGSRVTALNDCPPTIPASAGYYAVAWTKTDGSSFLSPWSTLGWNSTAYYSVGSINPYMATFYLFAAPASTPNTACTRFVLSLDVNAVTVPVQACASPTPFPSATSARTPTPAATLTRSRTGTRTPSRSASTGAAASATPTASAPLPSPGGGGAGASATATASSTASETPSSSSTASGTASGTAAATASLTTGVSASLTATMTASATVSRSVPASAAPTQTWMLDLSIIDAVNGVGGGSAGGAAPGAGDSSSGGDGGGASKGGLSGRSIGIIVASVICGLVIAGVLLFLLWRRRRGRRSNGAQQLRDGKLPPLTMELRPPGISAGKPGPPLDGVPSKAGPGNAGRRSAVGDSGGGAAAPDLAAALQTFARPAWRRQSRVSGVSAPPSDAAAKALQQDGPGLRLASLPVRPRALDDASARSTPAGVAAKALSHVDAAAAARPQAAAGKK